MNLRIEPTGENTTGRCECCGNVSRTVWGEVYGPDGAMAVYYIQWTVGAPDHLSNFDFLIGKWGEGATEQDRVLVSFTYNGTHEDGGAFMVIDSEGRPAAKSDLCGRALKREEVLGTSLMDKACAIIDAVWLNDPRIDEVKNPSNEA